MTVDGGVDELFCDGLGEVESGVEDGREHGGGLVVGFVGEEVGDEEVFGGGVFDEGSVEVAEDNLWVVG